MQLPAWKNHPVYISLRTLLSVFFLILPLFFYVQYANAQGQPVQSQPLNTNQYSSPNFDPGVPLNQHTFVQSIVIETISAGFCLLTGMDPINPTQGCLDINPITHKLTLASPNQNQVGGLIGVMPSLFSQVYAPPASSAQYVHYLADNFGIVNPATAQTTQVNLINGFNDMKPVLAIWVSVRNIAYLAFVLIFILIGLGIMLRIKIDPRTVMTIQNQIPRIIIGIILITFSYAISGLLIDVMWASTFMGINAITESGGSATNPVVQGTGCDQAGQSLQNRATSSLRTFSVFSYAQSILTQDCGTFSGIPAVAWGVSKSIGNTVQDLINFAFYGPTRNPTANCSIMGFLGKSVQYLNYVNPVYWVARGEVALFKSIWGSSTPSGQQTSTDSADSCWAWLLGGAVGWLLKILVVLIVVCIILFTLFRIWLELLRSYVMVIIYTITGPIWIMMGLLPGKPLGFGSWLRRLVANLAVFPATALLLVTASYLIYAFENVPAGDSVFIPPFVGNPEAGSIGYLIGFGILLVTPSLLNILKTSFHAVGKQGMMATQSITNMMAGGSSVPKGIGRMTKNRIFSGYDPTRNHMGIGWQVLGGRNPSSLRFRLVHGLGGTGMNKANWDRYTNSGQNPPASGGSGKKTP